MKKHLFLLILLTTTVQLGYTQKLAEDNIKLYSKITGEYHFIPSYKLQYFSTPATGDIHTDNSSCTNTSANVAGGISYDAFRLEIGPALSWLEIDNNGGISAKDIAIPIAFSVRALHKSGFGVHMGLKFEPHKFFDYHAGNDCRVVSDWGSKGGVFLEIDKQITRHLSIFAKFGFDAALNHPRFGATTWATCHRHTPIISQQCTMATHIS